MNKQEKAAIGLAERLLHVIKQSQADSEARFAALAIVRLLMLADLSRPTRGRG